MNPPNTAQIVKTKLLVLPTESAGCLRITSGILKLKHENIHEKLFQYLLADLNGIRTNSVEGQFIIGYMSL